MDHTLACLEAQARARAWVENYPAYCTRCGGLGVVTWPAIRDTPSGQDLCSCLEENRCPRCGESAIEARWSPEQTGAGCTACGWCEDKAADLTEVDQMHIPWHECLCGVEGDYGD